MIHDFSLLSAFGEAKLLDDQCHFKKVKFNCVDKATVTLQFDGFAAEVTGSWLSTDKNHPIIFSIAVTEKNGEIRTLLVDDYTIRGTEYDDHDAFYLELKTVLESINKNKQPTNHINLKNIYA